MNKNLDKQGPVAPYLLEVSKGNVSGVSLVDKFGFASVGTSFVDLWDEGTAYTYLTSATVLKISSSNTNDSSLGTGMRTAIIEGLDSNYDEISETITLNGQTSVNTSNSYIRVHKIKGVSYGSNEANLGKIYAGTGTVTQGIPASIFARITIGLNRTLMCMYTIPSGKSGYLYQVTLSSPTQNQVEVYLAKREIGKGFEVLEYITLSQSSFDHLEPFPEKFTEKTDLTLKSKVDTGNALVSGGFYLILIDN